MNKPDPQQPAEPPHDGQAEYPTTEQASGPLPGPYDDPPMPLAYDPQMGHYGPQPGQPYGPQPAQAYDPLTGMPLGPPPGPQGAAAYNAPYGPPPGYGPPYQGGYRPPGYYVYPPFRPTNGMAIASLVLGILWLYWIGSVLALIFGYVARQQIAQRGESGDGMAIAGIVLGWIGVGVLVLVVFFVLLGAAASVV